MSTITRRANAAYVRKDPGRWKHTGWTSVPNSLIRDPDVSPDECWAWAWLASHDGEFEVSGAKLWHAKNALAKTPAYELLRSLEQRGLLLRHREYDPETGVPYVVYDLQPEPVPEDQRTWTPSRAKPKAHRPHPGAKDAAPVDNPVSPGQDGFPTGRESVGGQRVPDGPGIRPELGIPDQSGSGGTSRLVGSRPVGNPYIEEKITREVNPPPPSAPQVPDSPPPATVVEVVESPPPDTTAAQALLASLPPPWTPGPRIVARAAPMVQDYLNAGWTADALCARWTSVPAQNPQGALLYRIEDTPPCPAATGPARGTPVRPACDACGAHEGDPWTWREDRDTGKPCPVCRPDAAASA